MAPDEDIYFKGDGIHYPKDEWYYKYFYDIKKILLNCTRCSNCKWIDSWEVKNARFARVCPSNAKYLFDAYSCQGRHDISLAILEGRLKYDDSPKLLDIFYKCDTCGGCDASCKRQKDTEPLRMLLDMRAKLVEDGMLLPQHMPIIESLRREDNTMLGRKTDRGKWCQNLNVKDLADETAEVVFHAGCHVSFSPEMYSLGEKCIRILQKGGLDVGVFGAEEACCGCKSYDMGYRGTSIKYAEHNMEAWKRAKVKTVITACADCYWAFQTLYAKEGSNIKVFHMVQFIEKLLEEGTLQFKKDIPLKVTYHDPCHLGRRSNTYTPGKAIAGIYDAPRNILKHIPGVEFLEMYRIKEYAWCCGAGGGVRESFPELSLFTASERIQEAESLEVEAMVTACPWCETSFREACIDSDSNLNVLDIIDLVEQAL